MEESKDQAEVGKLFNVPVELFELDKITLNKNKTAKVEFRIVDVEVLKMKFTKVAFQ